MIIQDDISRGAFLITILVTIYLGIFQTTTIIIFPAILLMAGMVMEYQLERKGAGFKREESPDVGTGKSDLTKIMYYAVIGFIGILITGYLIDFSKFMKTLTMTSLDAMLYGGLMAVSEEMFFRGFITDFLLTSVKLPNPALLMSAGIFTAYHFARYGTQIDALLYVFAGGFILSYIAYKSRRLSPSILAHVANNVIATLGVI